MHNRILAIVALAAGLLLLQCSDHSKLTKLDMQGRGEQFSVRLGEKARIPGSDLYLAFDSLLRDNRCKTSSSCHSFGAAEVLFEVIPEFGESKKMSLAVEAPRAIMDEQYFYVDIFGYRLALLDVFYGSPTGEAPRSDPPYAHLAVTWAKSEDTLDGVVKIVNTDWGYAKIDDYAIDTATLDGDILTLTLADESDFKGFFALCVTKRASFDLATSIIPLHLLHILPRGPGSGKTKQLLRFDIGGLRQYCKDNLGDATRVTLTLPSSMSGYISGPSLYLGLGEKLSQQSLLPASMGNYWIYRHVYSRAWMENYQPKSAVDTLLDSLFVIDSTVIGGHTWWRLSKSIWPVGDRFYMSGDTLFGYHGPMLLPLHDGGATLGSTTGVWVPEPYETDCGTFSNCNLYYSRTERYQYAYDERNAIVSPGVGILYSMQDNGCSPMTFDEGFCTKTRHEFTLLRCHIE